MITLSGSHCNIIQICAINIKRFSDVIKVNLFHKSFSPKRHFGCSDVKNENLFSKCLLKRRQRNFVWEFDNWFLEKYFLTRRDAGPFEFPNIILSKWTLRKNKVALMIWNRSFSHSPKPVKFGSAPSPLEGMKTEWGVS